MSKRIVRHIYHTEKFCHKNRNFYIMESEDGTLFYNSFKTKIKPEDLPEWYLYGRYYKRCGYMSTKGIIDLVYIPSNFGTYLKDDCLLVSYKDIIRCTDLNANDRFAIALDKYTGYDERVYGAEIITILKGAREYSGYDVMSISEQIQARFEQERERRPEDYNRTKIDYVKMISEGIDKWARKR